MILTGEPSGDFHGAALIRELRSQWPGIRISGIGGPGMAKEEAYLFYDIANLSAMGLIQVVKQFSAIKAAFNIFKRRLRTDRPDLVVFIDYPGFNLRAAQYLKSRYTIPTCYYIAPKVWAWNEGRLAKIRACMDHVALILPFEAPLYKKHGIPATYVGNPLVDEYPDQWLENRLSNTTKALSHERPVIGLLPGSRVSEIRTLLPVMLDAALQILKTHPGATFLISAASDIRERQIRTLVEHHPAQKHCRIVPGRPLQVFEKASAVIAASGTVTLEAGLCGLPTTIIYKVSPLTYFLGKLVVKIKYAGLANLIVNREIMPEFIQDTASPQNIARSALGMLANPSPYIQDLKEVRLRLGRPGAPARCARIILNLLGPKP